MRGIRVRLKPVWELQLPRTGMASPQIHTANRDFRIYLKPDPGVSPPADSWLMGTVLRSKEAKPSALIMTEILAHWPSLNWLSLKVTRMT